MKAVVVPVLPKAAAVTITNALPEAGIVTTVTAGPPASAT
jgi:hypothetical protein